MARVSHRWKLPVWVLLLSVVLLAALLRIGTFSGYIGSDMGVYSWYAYKMAKGEFRAGTEVLGMRVGLFAPAALAFKIVGRPDERALVAYPFALSLLSVILAYSLARVLLGHRAALIAAAIQAIVPIDTRSASLLLSDLPAAFWGNLGVLLILLGGARPSLGAKTALGVLGGLAFGVSWLTKETIVYLLPFVAGYLAWLCYRGRRNLVLAISASAGVLAILAGESLVYYLHTGDLLYRYHVTERNYQVARQWFFTEGSPYGWIEGRYWSALLRRLLFQGPVAIFLNINIGLVPGAALLGVLYAVARRVRALTLPALWFVSLVLLFNFGSSSLQAYRPLPLTDRYLYPIFLPAVILLAGFLDILIQRPSNEVARERLFWGSVLAAGIAVICLFGVYAYARAGVGSPVARAAARILEPRDRVFTDPRTADGLSFFWGYPNVTNVKDFEGMSASANLTNVKDFEGMSASAVPPGTYVLIDRSWIDFLRSTYGYRPPDFYDRIPRHWIQKWSGWSGVLYWVEGK